MSGKKYQGVLLLKDENVQRVCIKAALAIMFISVLVLICLITHKKLTDVYDIIYISDWGIWDNANDVSGVNDDVNDDVNNDVSGVNDDVGNEVNNDVGNDKVERSDIE